MAGEKNKEKRILDAAVALFTAQGFAATRMEDVAKKAGISKGLTYFYYKNKEDLYMALTKKAFEQLKDEFRESLRAKGKNGLEMLTDLVQRIWKFAKEQPVYYHSIIHFLDLLKKYTSPELKSQINTILEQEVSLNILGSAEMVAKAQKSEGFTCQEADISTVKMNRSYDAILALFHVISYQTTNNKLNSVFANASRHLNKDGLFVYNMYLLFFVVSFVLQYHYFPIHF